MLISMKVLKESSCAYKRIYAYLSEGFEEFLCVLISESMLIFSKVLKELFVLISESMLISVKVLKEFICAYKRMYLTFL